MNLNVKKHDLTNRDQITTETEALFKYLLKVKKKMKKLTQSINGSQNKSNQKEIMTKKLLKLYNDAIGNEMILSELDPPIYEVNIKYDAMEGIDTDEIYFKKEHSK